MRPLLLIEYLCCATIGDELVVDNCIFNFGVEFRIRVVVDLASHHLFESFDYRVANVFFEYVVDEMVAWLGFCCYGPQLVSLFIYDVVLFDRFSFYRIDVHSFLNCRTCRIFCEGLHNAFVDASVEFFLYRIFIFRPILCFVFVFKVSLGLGLGFQL